MDIVGPLGHINRGFFNMVPYDQAVSLLARKRSVESISFDNVLYDKDGRRHARDHGSTFHASRRLPG